MQKLIYQNLRGQQVVFCHAPYVLCKLRSVGLNGLDVTAVNGAYQQGESITLLRRKGRKVKLTLHLMANSREEMYRLRSELLGALRPELAFDGTNRARLIYENDYGRRWTWAAPESGLDWGDRKQDVHPSLTLNFRCECPYWFSIGRHETMFRARENGLTLPVMFPFKLGSKVFGRTAVNQGQADTPVLVEITGCGEKPRLVNDSTGREIALINPLLSGDVLTVNTDPADLSVMLTHEDGTSESGYGLLDPACSVAGFMLRPGENALRYVPDGENSESIIKISWYDRFEGV